MTALFSALEINMEEQVYTEGELNTNLNELAHEIIRELYIAAKKVAVYSISHPLSQKAVGRPFILMDRVFKFKRYFNLHISSGQLYALNIRMRPSIFTEQIIEYMQILDIKDILFEYGLSVNQLVMFLERFVKRLPGTDYQNLMSVHLERNKIDRIHVNSSQGQTLFDRARKFHGQNPGDFSVRNIVSLIIGDDFERLADILADENRDFEQYLLRYGHDYYLHLAKYLVPEKIASIPAEQLANLLADRLNQAVKPAADSEATKNATSGEMRHLIAALNYHPDREEIIERFNSHLSSQKQSRELIAELLPPTSAIRIESSEKIDLFLGSIFSDQPNTLPISDFSGHFERLLRTGQQGKAKAIIHLLMEHLAGNNLDFRRNALALLDLALGMYSHLSGPLLIEYMISQIDGYITSNRETFEFSELIWKIAQICLADKRNDYLSSLCDTLRKKCHRSGEIASYDSFAVKKALTELNRREVINQLLWELIEGQHGDFHYIKNIFTTIGSEEVAFALSTIISHESRQVRQSVLKILSELGKSSLNVFTRIMEDNANFEREENRRELPDAKWYVVRNSIFVLGALRDPDGCRPLRTRLTDSDTRVRSAVVSALERIGGEEAADLLMMMAEDPDREIREAAIIALGFVGRPDITPELIDLSFRRNSEIIKIIGTLAKLGGEETRKFLFSLLTDAEMQSRLTSNRSSRDGGSKLNRAAKDILDRQ
jgi:hypothetical protein